MGGSKDYYIPISMEGLPGDRYGIYRDGTVVNLEIPMTLGYFYKRGVKMVELSGFKKKFQMPIIKLLAKVYVQKTEDDIKRKREEAILIDPKKSITADNVRWVNVLERKLIYELWEIENPVPRNYVIPICKLLQKGYTPKEISNILRFDNMLFIYNIKNRRIFKDFSKKYNF